MDFTHVYQLHKYFSSRRYPVSQKNILAELEWSESTFYRVQQYMKDLLGAPIVNKRGQGYYYNTNDNQHYELPGIWFSSSEVIALGIIEQLSEAFQPEVVKQLLSPLKERLKKLLEHQSISWHGWESKIKIVSQWDRETEPESFNKIAHALFHRQQMDINYWQWSTDKVSQRIISPQRLVFYRNNWYLDAWCHNRRGLRSFSVDAITINNVLDSIAIDMQKEELDEQLTSGYGIFSGQANNIAKLKFSLSIAKRVSSENWHPNQQSYWIEDDQYVLTVPYSDHRELLRDILHFGSEVEVLAPEILRLEVKKELEKTLQKYI